MTKLCAAGHSLARLVTTSATHALRNGALGTRNVSPVLVSVAVIKHSKQKHLVGERV